MFFAKVYVPNWSDEVFEIKKVQNTCRGHMLLAILEAKKLLERFTKRKSKKQIKKSIELKKRNTINYILNGKVPTVFLTVRLIKNT